MFRFFLPVLLAAAVLAADSSQGEKFRDLRNYWVDPFDTPARARVFLFVRTDCPLTNRYAPELQKLTSQFKNEGADFWLVYPDPTEQAQSVQKHVEQYQFPGTPLLDPKHQLVARAHATVAPEAAVFNAAGQLTYHGRIDDRYIDIGKSRPGGPQIHDLQRAITLTLDGEPVLPAQTRAIGCSLADVE